MNKINYILITLLLGGSVSLNAQTSKAASEMQLADTLSIGYQMNVSSRPAVTLSTESMLPHSKNPRT